MGGIYGITGLPEPASTTPEPARGKRSQVRADAPSTSTQDQVTLSPQAQQASAASRAASDEVRMQRIAETRRQLEEGTYRIQQVVLTVAARISKYLAEA